jgi:ribosomal protein S18 acetylase RimI-like enzyme
METEIASASLMTMRMLIREAALRDSAEIARVQVDTWRTTYRGIVPQSFLDEMDCDARAEWWREQLASGTSRTSVLEVDGILCGFIDGGRLREPVSNFDGEVYAFYIATEAQGCGCGRAMLRHLARELLQDGLTSAVVWVLEKNPACGFYARLGGEPAARQTITIGGADLEDVAYGWRDLRLLAEDAAS